MPEEKVEFGQYDCKFIAHPLWQIRFQLNLFGTVEEVGA